MIVTVIEVKLEDQWYCGYYHGKPITKQRTAEKTLKKLLAYVKGQS